MLTYRRGRVVRHEKAPEGGVLSLLGVGLLFLGVPAWVVLVETSHYARLMELQSMLDAGFEQLSAASAVGTAVHLQSRDIVVMSRDEAFGVRVLGAVNLRRETEYCQWQEIATRKCDTCQRPLRAKDGSRRIERYSCNCVTKYSYIKGWRSRRIISSFFVQPAAHHNPQRDPWPSATLPAASALLTTTPGVLVTVGASALRRTRAKWRRIAWTPGGHGSSSQWSGRPTRYEALAALTDFRATKAFIKDGFVYVGNGWFYSAYEQSVSKRLVRGLFQYLEGSLLDWQLGDLVPSCTAGDIRVRYQIQDPKRLSILATVTANRKGHLEVGDSGAMRAIVQAGFRDAATMIAVEASDSLRRAQAARFALGLWAFAAAALLGTVLGVDVTFRKDVHCLAAAATTLAVLAVVWAVEWGFNRASRSIAVSFLCSSIATSYVIRIAPPTVAKPGLRAAYCQVARWANLPPSWRVESSYRDTPSSKLA